MPLYSPESDQIVGRYTRTQRVNGGKKRASTAKRHAYGFFLPDSADTVLLSENYIHGQAGGIKRAITGKRIRGRYIKNDENL